MKETARIQAVSILFLWVASAYSTPDTEDLQSSTR
jgi:hypothetical protein